MESNLIDQYIQELEKDVKIDQFNLKEAQLGLPGVKHKWAGRLIRHKIELNTLSSKRNQAIKAVVEQLKSESHTPLPTAVLEKSANRHQSIQDIDNRIQELKLLIEFLEKTEKTLSSMTFDISNIVKIMTLETT